MVYLRMQTNYYKVTKETLGESHNLLKEAMSPRDYYLGEGGERQREDETANKKYQHLVSRH